MSSPFHDHHIIGEWHVFVSDDGGDTWTESYDPTIPYNWDSSSVGEAFHRYTKVLPDGRYLSAGSVGWQVWPSEKRLVIEEKGLEIRTHPVDEGKIVSGCNRMFVQRSADGGRTWDRREYTVPGFAHIQSFPRSIELVDGTILIPGGAKRLGGGYQSYNWRSADGGRTFRLFLMGAPPSSDESTFLEISPDRILALARANWASHTGHLLEMWSDDAGLTWSHPVESEIWAPHSPPHLLKLRDGRVLCSYGYRACSDGHWADEPMGIRAVLSYDMGESWDTDNEYLLRDDGGFVSKSTRLREPRSQAPSADVGHPQSLSDVGYAQSTELADGSILTVYYITLADGVTHIACTRWEL